MEKKKKGVMQSIPGWAWVLISLAAAILLWYALSINPKQHEASHLFRLFLRQPNE